MKIILEGVGTEKGETVKQKEVGLDHLLWIRLELRSGEVLTVAEQGDSAIAILSGTGNLLITPAGSNAIIVQSSGF